MSVTQEQLDLFHRFASDCLRRKTNCESLEDLLIAWDSSRDRHEINAAIREGLADVDAGRTRPANEFTRELKAKYALPE